MMGKKTCISALAVLWVLAACVRGLGATDDVHAATGGQGKHEVPYSLPPPPPEVDVAARAQAIASLPSVFCADVLSQPEVLPGFAADAPVVSLLLSADPRMVGDEGSALASDTEVLLQRRWVLDGGRLSDRTLRLRDWPNLPRVTKLAKYTVGDAVIFIATSNWDTRAAINTSPGKRVHSFGTHEALAQHVLELCRQLLSQQFVPADAADIVRHTKFSLLGDGATGVLSGRMGPLGIWSDGQTLVAAGRLFDRSIWIPLGALGGALSAGAPPAVRPAVLVDGRTVFPEGKDTALVDGFTMVPLTGFCGGVGAEVRWIPEATAATVTWGGRVAWLQQANRTAMLDGVETGLSVPPTVVKGKMLVPLRPLVEWMGGTLAWNEEGRIVNVFLPALVASSAAPAGSREPTQG